MKKKYNFQNYILIFEGNPKRLYSHVCVCQTHGYIHGYMHTLHSWILFTIIVWTYSKWHGVSKKLIK